jgi:NDP-4-keto-2,6-dideoxyhexose 3-C-methyltransferase
MFYDLENPYTFLNDVKKIMNDNGLFVLQMSYTPLMVQQMAFDNICHEHLMYYSLSSLKYVLDKSGFTIMDCELNDVNGGSFRVYCQKENADHSTFASAPYRDVAKYRVDSLLEYEKHIGANMPEFYMDFYSKVQKLKESTVDFIKEKRCEGKTICVYGASTKGNTLLQYFGIDSSLINYAVERSSYKFGLKTVGTNIEIVSEEFMRQNPPDYLLILPWHFVNEFISREKEYLDNGGHFIVPCPSLRII